MKRMNWLLMVSLLTLMACKKTKNPDPLDPAYPSANEFFLQIKTDVQLLPQDNIQDLEFIVTLKNNNGELVVENKKLSITAGNGFYSGKIKLPIGQYSLVKAFIARKSGLVRFATPHTGFPKAQLITKPLPINIARGTDRERLLTIEMVAVQTGDQESSFGYPDGDFLMDLDNEDPQDNSRTLQLQAQVNEGSVVYDDVPVSLRVQLFNAQQQFTQLVMTLPAGVQGLQIPDDITQVKVFASKWGVTKELSVDMNTYNAQQIYKITISKTPQLLKAVIGSKERVNNWFAEKKTEFLYNNDGKVHTVNHYRKYEDGAPYLAFSEQANFAGNKIVKITRRTGDNRFLGVTDFVYNADGLYSTIRHQEGNDSVTNMQLQYIMETDQHQQRRILNYGVQIAYSFWGLPYTHQGEYSGGNLINFTRASNNGTYNYRMFEYDKEINPFYQTGWPDLNDIYPSKNNRKRQYATFVNEYPQTEIYEYSYKYDGNGYPVELITSHRDPVTRAHLFRYKETFQY